LNDITLKKHYVGFFFYVKVSMWFEFMIPCNPTKTPHQ